VKDYIEQAQKPLARYRDDQDLDALLKQKEREGKRNESSFNKPSRLFVCFFYLDDPMLKYLTNKTSDSGDRTNTTNKAPAKPRYRGPEPQKNRYEQQVFHVSSL
jgi:pre-mRNA-splicing factor CWC26